MSFVFIWSSTNWTVSGLAARKPEWEEKETSEKEISTCIDQNLLLNLWDKSGLNGLAWEFILPEVWALKEGGVDRRGQQKSWSVGQRQKMQKTLWKPEKPPWTLLKPTAQAESLFSRLGKGKRELDQGRSTGVPETQTPTVEKGCGLLLLVRHLHNQGGLLRCSL